MWIVNVWKIESLQKNDCENYAENVNYDDHQDYANKHNQESCRSNHTYDNNSQSEHESYCDNDAIQIIDQRDWYFIVLI